MDGHLFVPNDRSLSNFNSALPTGHAFDNPALAEVSSSVSGLRPYTSRLKAFAQLDSSVQTFGFGVS